MKILYLSYDGLTDPLGGSQILPYLIGLSKEGYRFTVLSFEKKNAFERLGKEIEQVCIKNEIDWTPLPYHKKPPILSTIYDIWSLWHRVKLLYKLSSFDVIHCRSYITALVGLRAKRKWKVKFVFDMRGFWADERVEGGLWKLSNPVYMIVYRYFKKKESNFLKEADCIVSLTFNAKKEIQSWEITKSPIIVIPTCVDIELFNPKQIKEEQQDDLRQKLRISKEEFVLLYLGSWGTWYLTNEMLIFFSHLKQSKPKSKFLIVSNDTINISTHPFKNDIVIVSSTRMEVPIYTSLASAAICFIKPSFSKKASSATKIGEILAMNVPVITNEGWGDIKDFEERGSVFITPLLPENYDSLIKNELQAGLRKRHSKLIQLSLFTGIESYSYIYQKLNLSVTKEF